MYNEHCTLYTKFTGVYIGIHGEASPWVLSIDIGCSRIFNSLEYEFLQTKFPLLSDLPSLVKIFSQVLDYSGRASCHMFCSHLPLLSFAGRGLHNLTQEAPPL